MTHNQLSQSFVLSSLHSVLYALAPMGIGTPLVESVQSYVRRLAQAHCVRPFAMISYIIDAADTSVSTLAYERGGKKTSQEVNWRGMSGLGKVAQRWVNRLSELTGRNDLAYLNFLPYQHGLTECGLSRLERAWCPMCYNDWRSRRLPVYDPLLWSVQAVTFCPYHHTQLETMCPHCGRTPHHFGKHAHPGCCSFCGGWLGDAVPVPFERSGHDPVANVGDEDFGVWATDVFSRLLAASPCLETWPRHGHLSQIFTWAFQAHGITLSEFARHLGLPIGTAWLWMGGRRQCVPQTQKLLSFCFRAGIDLATILTLPCDSQQVIDVFAHVASEIITVDRKNKRLPFPDTFDVAAALKAELAQPEVAQPLYVIAAQLGCTTKQLRYREPELCDALVARHREWRHIHRPGHAPTAFKKIRFRHQLEQAREQIQLLLNSDTKPPLKIEEVSRRVGVCTSTLYRYLPELCKAFTDKRKNWFDADRATKALEHLMASHERPPRVQEAAYSLGHARTTLKDKIPEVYERFIQHRHKPLDVEAIRHGLEEALNSPVEPPVSLHALSCQLHLRRYTLEQLFPGLTQSIVQRYQIYRRARAIERESKLCEEVRLITRQLHTQRILPSQTRVARLISAPSFMRQPLGVQILRDERRRLGIGRWQRYPGL